MEIDDSKGLDETEFYKTKSFSGLTNSTGYQNYFNQHIDTYWQVTPNFILNTMNGIQQNQLIFDRNMSSHLQVLKDINLAIKELREEISKLKQ